MRRYAIEFTKRGYLKYTSHLDLLRLFKRVIKRSGIKLKYSQGFNPHPKIGFAQPLSLGYESICEYLEIETEEEYKPDVLKTLLVDYLPKEIEIKNITVLPDQGKSLSASCYEAEYLIVIPVSKDFEGKEKTLIDGYLSQKEIIVLKKQKKSKELKEVNIRDKIKSMEISFIDNNYIMTVNVDCGSESNLSPELVISSFCFFAGMDIDRSEIDVMRRKLKIHGFNDK